jgi:hypothetical protein
MAGRVRIASLWRSCALALTLPGAAAVAEGNGLPEVDPRLGGYVAEIVARAAHRFEGPGCSGLLDVFDDARTGRPLAETLRASGETPASHFARLRFYSGDERMQCRWRETWAWAAVGSEAVFVCRGRFTTLARKSEKAAANILVHEALHTLGLGENPPSSQEITAAVHAHCGR